MTEGKRDAVKRTRPLKKVDSLPIIIGLSVGVVLLAVVLILVWAFVLRKGSDNKDGPSDGTAVTETVEETGTETETESETESDNESESESESESETEGESEAETEISAEVTAILEGMTLEEKIDQLFLLTPVALVQANGADVSEVNTVGPTTTAAYEAIPLGGVVIGENNRGDDSQDIAVLIEDFRDLSGEVPLLIAMTQTDYNTFTSGGSDFTADILISGTSASMDNDMDLNIVLAVSTATAEQLIEILQNGADMILMTEDDFDYAQARESILEIIEAGETITESDIDQKVAAVLSQKLETSSASGTATGTTSAGTTETTTGTTGTGTTGTTMGTTSAGTTGSTTGTTGTGNTSNTGVTGND
ncbi:MAG: hypothetical protein LUH07_16020 [Lachnospiraceae bacterium]|nr:hypothetical protein [Lachnospiraceae bacterium]